MTTVTLYISDDDILNFYIIDSMDIFNHKFNERKQIFKKYKFVLHNKYIDNYIQVNIPLDKFMLYRSYDLLV